MTDHRNPLAAEDFTSLLGGAAEEESETTQAGLCEIVATDIKPSPYQFRETFVESEINSLADSIERSGLINPVSVIEVTSEIGSEWYLESGERRLRAWKQAKGADTPIPAIKSNTLTKEQFMHDLDTLERGIAENIKRQNLNYLEIGKAIATLSSDYGLTLVTIARDYFDYSEEQAEKTGKQFVLRHKTVNDKLAPSVRQSILEHIKQSRRDTDYRFSLSHAHTMVKGIETEEEQQIWFQLAVERKLTVNELKKAIEQNQGAAPKTGHNTSAVTQAKLKAIREQFTDYFGVTTKVDYNADKGHLKQITISIKNEDQQNSLLQKLGIKLKGVAQ